MTWTNITGIPYIDIFIGGLPNQVFGPGISIYVLFFLMILVFIVSKSTKEVILIAPAPVLIAFAEYSGQRWLTVVLWILAGIYVAMIFRKIGMPTIED